ncbi:MAG: UDP-N-acetylmuramoyl-L-alanine--D-glutamate ligase [Methanosphaera sp.]|nr:UDP-N-acetylmuramoyl-L-alanine--D-glutamate ligase [Methanosphaera sp.]
MNFKSCLVVGAGNAGRPVARLLNYKDVDVTITDSKTYDEFTTRRQGMLDILKDEGITLELGVKTPDVSGFDAIYLAPTIPKDAPIYEQIDESITIIDQAIYSSIIDEILDMDKIGITGSFGKTSTTDMLTHIFEAAGYNVYQCSSMKWNLVSEAIVDDIIRGEHIGADIAILELPHGTLGLMGKVHLNLGVITNLRPEHLCEFGGSMQRYIDRKACILDASDRLVANSQCGDLLTYKREDTIYFNFDNDEEVNLDKYPPIYKGSYQNDSYHIEYFCDDNSNSYDINLESMAYYTYENLTAAIATSIECGVSMEDIIKGLDNFTGVGGRMEYVGTYNGIDAYYDASYGDQSVRQALKKIENENLIILYDNVDSTTTRDKAESGRVIGDYANIVIATGYVEITDTLNMDAALELLGAIENPDVIKMAVCTMDDAAMLAMKYAKKGDIIVHLGPGASNSYEQVKTRMINGLKEGCKRYE